MNSINPKHFKILMPPPNVTGQLHIGHALTFWIQDVIVRNQHILGNKNSYLLAGYDHGGIATYKIARQSHKKELVTYEEIAQVAEKNKNLIRKQWEQWRLHINWNYLEYTMDPDHQKIVQNAFIDLYNTGYISRKKQIVAFDCKFKTAISQLEVEYQEQKGKIYTIPYKLIDAQEVIYVQTTRPETIFADVALAVHPEDSRYNHLIGKKVTIPLENREINIIADKRVEQEFGTGVLKITPAHSMTDWEIGKEHSLPIINIINSDGLSDLPHHPDYHNKKLIFLRKQVVEKLQCEQRILKQMIPYSSRSKTIVEYLVQDHWFISMKELANKAINTAPEFIPKEWKKVYENWLKEIRPWCISRTIPWGQKIPAYFNDKNEHYVGFKPPEGFKQYHEVFDTWFSSAFWPFLYYSKYKLTIDVLVTGYDIIFFWVARMIMGNLFYKIGLPFKKVIIHGLVCDKTGKKMSKTIGNVINPEDLIRQHGYNVTRFALLSGLIGSDRKVKFNDTILHISKKVLNKLKNFKYFIDHYDSNNPIISSDVENGIYHHINQYIQQYLDVINQHNIPKQIKIARDTLYCICDWAIEIAKVFNSASLLKFSLSTINHMFYPLLANDLPEGILHTKIINQNDNTIDFIELINKIHKIRSYNKQYKQISLQTSNPIIVHLSAVKNDHKQKYSLQIDKETIIYCSEPLLV